MMTHGHRKFLHRKDTSEHSYSTHRLVRQCTKRRKLGNSSVTTCPKPEAPRSLGGAGGGGSSRGP